jgi:hypothetical protein
MCGELDDNVQIGQDLLEKLKVMSGMLGLTPEGGVAGPKGLEAAEGRATYMESLFNAGLTRALADSNAAEPEEIVDAIASQAIAFGRLAGFMAGQLPPEADLFRTTMEAMMEGHAETARLVRQYRQNQDHAHGHSHDHDHHHH